MHNPHPTKLSRSLMVLHSIVWVSSTVLLYHLQLQTCPSSSASSRWRLICGHQYFTQAVRSTATQFQPHVSEMSLPNNKYCSSVKTTFSRNLHINVNLETNLEFDGSVGTIECWQAWNTTEQNYKWSPSYRKWTMQPWWERTFVIWTSATFRSKR